MATVSGLLSMALFKDFRLFSGRSGLNNKVTSAGFFEWEQDGDITRNFGQGEFVITTLSVIKDDPAAIEKSLKLLISNHVSAIAIKDIYFKELSDDIKDYSDRYGVPILFFTGTYIDEILYAIKNETLNNLYTSFNEIVLDTLISNDNLDNLEKENLLRKINPFFMSTSMMCAYISNKTDTSTISSGAMEIYNRLLPNRGIALPNEKDGANFIYSFIAYKRGIFLIVTSDSSDEEILSHFQKTLIEAFNRSEIIDSAYVGVSDFIHGIENIGDILLDAVFTNTSCLLDDKHILRKQDTSFDHIIFRNYYLYGTHLYYEQMLKKLNDNASQRAPLHETLINFVSCNGNIDLTAQKMFQHKNTIRYRISKLKTLFNSDSEMEFYGKLYFFSRIHFSKDYLDSFFDI